MAAIKDGVQCFKAIIPDKATVYIERHLQVNSDLIVVLVGIVAEDSVIVIALGTYEPEGSTIWHVPRVGTIAEVDAVTVELVL